MKSYNIKEEKARIEKLHEENKKRKNKLICGELGILGGFSMATIGLVFSIITGGVLPMVLIVVGLLGGCAGVVTEVYFNQEEAEVIDRLHDEYPFDVEKPSLFPGLFEKSAFNYTEKILKKLDDVERMEVMQSEVFKLEESDVENVENKEMKVDTTKLNTSIEKDDEIGE